MVHDSKCEIGDFVYLDQLSAYTLQRVNDVAIYQAESEVVLLRYLSSLLDFYASNTLKHVIAVEKGNFGLNRLVAIKRVFKPIDRFFTSLKKTFFEKAPPLKAIVNLPLHNLVAIKTEDSYILYDDVVEDKAPFNPSASLPPAEWIAESESTYGKCMAICRNSNQL